MTCVMWLSDTLLGYCMWLPDIFAGLQHCVAVSSASSGLWPVWCGFQMPLLGCNIMLPYQMFFVAFRCLCWVTAWVAWASCVAQWPLKLLLLPSSHTSTCSTSGLLRLQVCAVHSFQSPRSYAGELGQQITKHSYRDLNRQLLEPPKSSTTTLALLTEIWVVWICLSLKEYQMQYSMLN